MPIGPAMSKTVFEQRVARTRVEMARQELEALVIFSDPSCYGIGRSTLGHIRYLTGWTGPFSPSMLILPVEGEAALLVTQPFDLGATEESDLWVKDVRCDPGGMHGAVARVILEEREITNARVGIVGGDDIPAPVYRDLVSMPFSGDFQPADSLLLGIRVIKGPEEIELQRQAALLADTMIDALVRAAQAASPWAWKLLVEAEYTARLEGAELAGVWLSTGPAIDRPKFSLRENLRRLQSGDQLLMGTYIIYEGYLGHSVRMGFKGQQPPAYRDAYAAAQAVQDVGRSLLHPGTDFSQVNTDMLGAIEQRYPGVINPFAFRAAHGLGMDYGDRPLTDAVPQPPGWSQTHPTQPAIQVPLRTGMTLELHPNLLDPAVGLAIVGDMFLITDSGPERLTKYPQEPFAC